MENSKEQAFPCINPAYDGNWNKEPIKNGLTKREYFAVLAMQSLIAGHELSLSIEEAQVIAGQSIQFADELLKKLGE